MRPSSLPRNSTPARSGDRPENVLEPVVATDGRSREAIAHDQARVTQQLAAARAERCITRCDALGARRETLSAQLAALTVEARVAVRSERAIDRAVAERERVRARQEHARIDPVTSRAAQLLGLSLDAVDLTLALLFGLLLECVACLGWLQGLAVRRNASVAHDDAEIAMRDRSNVAARDAPVEQQVHDSPVTTVEVVGHASVAPSHTSTAVVAAQESPSQPQSAFDSEAPRLVNAIAAGQVRLSVADIHRYLRCSQTKAAEMRRRVLALAVDEPSGVIDFAPTTRPMSSRPQLVHSALERFA